MFQAIISVCNLISMECILLKDEIQLNKPQYECSQRAENLKEEFINIYKGPVFIKKNCIKVKYYKTA